MHRSDGARLSRYGQRSCREPPTPAFEFARTRLHRVMIGGEYGLNAFGLKTYAAAERGPRYMVLLFDASNSGQRHACSGDEAAPRPFRRTRWSATGRGDQPGELRGRARAMRQGRRSLGTPALARLRRLFPSEDHHRTCSAATSRPTDRCATPKPDVRSTTSSRWWRRSSG